MPPNILLFPVLKEVSLERRDKDYNEHNKAPQGPEWVWKLLPGRVLNLHGITTGMRRFSSFTKSAS